MCDFIIQAINDVATHGWKLMPEVNIKSHTHTHTHTHTHKSEIICIILFKEKIPFRKNVIINSYKSRSTSYTIILMIRNVAN